MRILVRTIQILGACFMLAAGVLFAQSYLTDKDVEVARATNTPAAEKTGTGFVAPAYVPREQKATIFDAIAEYWAQLTGGNGGKEDKKKYGFKGLGNNNKLASAPAFSGIKAPSSDK